MNNLQVELERSECTKVHFFICIFDMNVFLNFSQSSVLIIIITCLF